MVSGTQLKLIAAGATTALAAASLTWQKHEKRGRGLLFRPADDSLVAAARTLNRGAGLLALAVAMDSAAEHYRGDFQNKAMYTPLAVSTLSLLASSQGQQDPDPASSRLRNGIYLGTVLTGLAGTAFHFYNVTKRPGGFCWSNLFYAAPLARRRRWCFPAYLVTTRSAFAQKLKTSNPGYSVCRPEKRSQSWRPSACSAPRPRPGCCTFADRFRIRPCTCQSPRPQ